jgi:hypothetical protein
LPPEIIVTPANESDSPYANSLLKGAKEKHPELKIDSADAAYDAYENYRFAVEEIGVLTIVLTHLYQKIASDRKIWGIPDSLTT